MRELLASLLDWYLGALDQGTTSSRAIVFDETGSVVSRAQREFRRVYSRGSRAHGRLLIVVGLPAAVVLYQFVVRRAVADVRVIDITAQVPEAGGRGRG